MKALQKNKSLVIAVILFIIAIFVYKSFFSAPAEDITTDPAAASVGQDVLALKASLQSVTLDRALFSSPLYRALIDFSTPINPQPTGRKNPFNPIGVDSNPPTGVTAGMNTH